MKGESYFGKLETFIDIIQLKLLIETL